MPLQLPEQGAPPPDWSTPRPEAEMHMSHPSKAHLTSPAHKIAPSRSNGEARAITSRSPFLLKTSPAHAASHSSTLTSAHARSGFSNGRSAASSGTTAHNATTAKTPIMDVNESEDVWKLEEMLHHITGLLNNESLCAVLPGGKDKLMQRRQTIESRIHHLDSMQNINRRMRESNLEKEAQQTSPRQSIPLNNGNVAKKEEDDMPLYGEELDEPDGKPVVSPLSSSPPPNSPLPQNWKQNILNRSTMHGKIGQLSLEESLALQAKESARAQEELATRRRQEAKTMQVDRAASRFSDFEVDEVDHDVFDLPPDEYYGFDDDT